MSLAIKEVNSKSDVKKFVKFQYELYKGDKFWIPPMISDEEKILKAETNPAYEFCDVKLFLAYKGDQCVGRIAAIINHPFNEKCACKYGRFSRIEFIDDKEVSKALIDNAVKWFREKGMEYIHGPLGFTNLDNQGMLIEGFDYLPAVASVYHKSYYKEHFDELGFEKENDWVEFRLTIGENATKKASRGADLIMKRYGYKLINTKSKKDLKVYGAQMFRILNQAFLELPYVVPLSDELIEQYVKKYIGILDHKYVKFVTKDDKLIGFFIGMPSLSKAMQKAKGRLLPFGIFPIMKAMKNPENIDMLLTGVLPEYQSTGVAVVLISELQKSMLNNGLNILETTGVFETNANVISNWKNYEHVQHKRRRCFVKRIS